MNTIIAPEPAKYFAKFHFEHEHDTLGCDENGVESIIRVPDRWRVKMWNHDKTQTYEMYVPGSRTVEEVKESITYACRVHAETRGTFPEIEFEEQPPVKGPLIT